ncbi:GIY-YIG nuclease family protein [Giesbergeria anulus]|uniref:GIY-YIG nuclease family protein n=1 Tax=Giesbergeria anulus TaxID=180197 RepID=UPI0015A56A80|nr:GIY-YIG nuclease family protein [Giesbergeria anulus]
MASRDDWPGRAVIFPRSLAGEVKGRKEYQQPGVYLLVGSKRMYIGEGDPVGDRIDSHVKHKDFWRKGVFFTAEGGRLNKAHVQHLESRLISLAKYANRVPLDNVNQPTVPALSEEDTAFTENFLHEILLMLPLLGFWQLSEDEDTDEAQEDAEASAQGDEASVGSTGKRAALYSSIPKGLQFKLTARNADAALEVVEGGVVIKKGSRVADPVAERFELDAPSYAALRRQLCESNVIAQTAGGWIFTKDQFFSSGSAAAAVARGAISNADWWKGSQGKSLGDYIREVKAKA